MKSGAPKAITALRKIYRDEKDENIKEAAEYAARASFKALDRAIKRKSKTETVGQALERPENAHIVQLLEDITINRAFGKRKRITTGFSGPHHGPLNHIADCSCRAECGRVSRHN